MKCEGASIQPQHCRRTNKLETPNRQTHQLAALPGKNKSPLRRRTASAKPEPSANFAYQFFILPPHPPIIFPIQNGGLVAKRAARTASCMRPAHKLLPKKTSNRARKCGLSNIGPTRPSGRPRVAFASPTSKTKSKHPNQQITMPPQRRGVSYYARHTDLAVVANGRS